MLESQNDCFLGMKIISCEAEKCSPKVYFVVIIYMLMRDVEGRKKEVSKAIQTTSQSNTTHPKQSSQKCATSGWIRTHDIPHVHVG